MHWKKYAILLPPFLIIGLLLVIYLPTTKSYYLFLVAILFWLIYYAWIAIEKKNSKRDLQ